MTRRVVAAMVLWAVAVGCFWLLFAGGQVQGCLGPLGVTPEQCRAALGLLPETASDHVIGALGSLVVPLLAGWGVIALVARGRRRPADAERQPARP